MPESADDDITVLERFVLDCDELLELEAKIGRFNIFDALRVERREIEHSNFLAWLLNPSESHGQGDLFLKAVLMDMFRRAPRIGRPLSPAVLDGQELHDVEIRREDRNIDLLIRSEDPKFVIAIENKIDSGEHSDQLARYEKTVRGAWPGVPAMFVFLTPDGLTASAEGWVTYGYSDLHHVLTRVLKSTAGSLGGEVATFLKHYLDLIGSRLMNDPTIDDLCKQIYVQHRRAIDLIVARIPKRGSEVVAMVRRYLAEKPDQWLPRDIGSQQYVQIVPASWVGTLSTKQGTRHAQAPCDLFVEFEVWADSRFYLSARVTVGQGEEQESRIAVMERISKAWPGLKRQRKTPGLQWTRLGSQTLLTWNDDDLPTEDKVRQAMAAYLEPLAAQLGSLPELLRDLCDPLA